MEKLFTIKGDFFGYKENNYLFTYDGLCVGFLDDKIIYDKQGLYIGELTQSNHLAYNPSNKDLSTFPWNNANKEPIKIEFTEFDPELTHQHHYLNFPDIANIIKEHEL